jgi:hypothetical protein
VEGEIAGGQVHAYRLALAAGTYAGLNVEQLGREDPQTAVAMRGLGQLYMSMGDYVRAAPLLQQGVEIVERTLGGDDPLVALGLRLTGLLHEYRHDLDRARTDLERAVTRDIMTGYYPGLKNGLGRGEALRQVQLSLLRARTGDTRSIGRASSRRATGKTSTESSAGQQREMFLSLSLIWVAIGGDQ